MSIADLLTTLKAKNIKIWIENEKIKYHAPKNALNDELKNLILIRKMN